MNRPWPIRHHENWAHTDGQLFGKVASVMLGGILSHLLTATVCPKCLVCQNLPEASAEKRVTGARIFKHYYFDSLLPWHRSWLQPPVRVFLFESKKQANFAVNTGAFIHKTARPVKGLQKLQSDCCMEPSISRVPPTINTSND